MATLMSLPTEILSSIFTMSRWFSETHDDEGTGPLYGLCLTCRRFDSIARPLLLDEVNLFFSEDDTISLAGILLALIRRPELRPSVKKLCIVHHWSGVPDEIFTATKYPELLTKIPKAAEEFNMPPEVTAAARLGNTEAALLVLMALAYGVKELELDCKAPVSDVMWHFPRLVSSGLSRLPKTWFVSQHITELALMGPFQNRGANLNAWYSFPFLQLPNLNVLILENGYFFDEATLDRYSDQFEVEFDKPQDSFPNMPGGRFLTLKDYEWPEPTSSGVDVMEIRDCDFDEGALLRFLTLFQGLKTLRIFQNVCGYCMEDKEHWMSHRSNLLGRLTAEGFRSCILQHKDTLEVLEVIMFPRHIRMLPGRKGAPTMRLCKKLKSLYTVGALLKRVEGVRDLSVDLLPPSLEELDLEPASWMESQNKTYAFNAAFKGMKYEWDSDLNDGDSDVEDDQETEDEEEIGDDAEEMEE
ncbi:hypothetical protein MKZ38_000461 [Zalerion maritima]|uniref:F-box domain-containing protein n=1 Tax=Zalerion maritima TaxID=339359 RepID=A0AAD5S021_9PEZI|nr:hypothetical protein MKZ38_000461 [Zalerion maritima]